jgi:hypothetical protein
LGPIRSPPLKTFLPNLPLRYLYIFSPNLWGLSRFCLFSISITLSQKNAPKRESVSVFLFITIRFLFIKITFFSQFFNSICRWSKTNNLRSFPNFKTIINKIIPDTNQILSSNHEFIYVLHDEINKKLPGQTTRNTSVKHYPPNVIRLSKIICAFITESKYTAIFYFYMLSIFYFLFSRVFFLFYFLYYCHATSKKDDTKKTCPSFAIVSPNFHR